MASTDPDSAPPAEVTAALHALGKRRLVLAIHDLSFPGDPATDPGRGSPYSAAAHRFLVFARGLGFDGIMLGPQGITSRDNPSPYDGTLFSRNVLNIDREALAADPIWRGVSGRMGAPAAGNGAGLERVDHPAAWDRCREGLASLHDAVTRARACGDVAVHELDRALGAFREVNRGWLEDDGLYFALAARQGHRHHRDWGCVADRDLLRGASLGRSAAIERRASLLAELAVPVERHVLGQFAVHRQHAAFRERLRGLGLRLYSDLQVGLSPCDEWQHEHLYLAGYRLGAPPSRTNPEGQPWGYRVFDPALYRAADGSPGPVTRFVERRLHKLLEESDGLRVDHPHGLVCPWVYREGGADPHRAVRGGARLFSSPGLEDHPQLDRHAIVRPDQLAGPDVPRHADGRVRDLGGEQVARYGYLFDVLVRAVTGRGGGRDDIVCEVLSTCPFPLERVMALHGLGRFRVTQKANVHDASDVYRSENARPEDWIMVGNHDTPSILALARKWVGTAEGRDRAAYLAGRLCPGGGAEEMAAGLAADPRRLVEAQLADVFASDAAHVLVFFADLLGVEETYNRPGTVHEDNWSLRVPPDYDRRRHAPDLRRVLALALRARGGVGVHGELIERLRRGAA